MMSSSQSRYQGYADLHTHSYHSDGKEAPETVAIKAAEKGLSGFALTDHDIMDGIPQARAKALELGIRFLPGVEMSTVKGRTEVHILGYFPHEPGREFLDVIDGMKRLRSERMTRMIESLNRLGCPIEEEFVLSYKGKGVVGRAHLFRAIKDRFNGEFDEKANIWLNIGGAAFEPTSDLSPQEAVGCIRQAGGVPVIAHPGTSGADPLLKELVDAGLMGIEAEYPRHDRSSKARYRKFARQHGLIVTGGSDWHGEFDPAGIYHAGSVGAAKVLMEVMDEIEGIAEKA